MKQAAVDHAGRGIWPKPAGTCRSWKKSSTGSRRLSARMPPGMTELVGRVPIQEASSRTCSRRRIRSSDGNPSGSLATISAYWSCSQTIFDDWNLSARRKRSLAGCIALTRLESRRRDLLPPLHVQVIRRSDVVVTLVIAAARCAGSAPTLADRNRIRRVLKIFGLLVLRFGWFGSSRQDNPARRRSLPGTRTRSTACPRPRRRTRRLETVPPRVAVLAAEGPRAPTWSVGKLGEGDRPRA